MSNEDITFNDKILCPYGELIIKPMQRAFLCTKDSNYPCGCCRYCRTDERYKMLYTSLQCPLKK